MYNALCPYSYHWGSWGLRIPGSLSYYGLAEEGYLGQRMPQRSRNTIDLTQEIYWGLRVEKIKGHFRAGTRETEIESEKDRQNKPVGCDGKDL